MVLYVSKVIDDDLRNKEIFSKFRGRPLYILTFLIRECKNKLSLLYTRLSTDLLDPKPVNFMTFDLLQRDEKLTKLWKEIDVHLEEF